MSAGVCSATTNFLVMVILEAGRALRPTRPHGSTARTQRLSEADFGSMITHTGGLREPEQPRKESGIREVTDPRSLMEWFQQEVLCAPSSHQDGQDCSEATSETATTESLSGEHSHLSRSTGSFNGLEALQGMLSAETLKSLCQDSFPMPKRQTLSLDNLPTMDDLPELSEQGGHGKEITDISTDEKLRIMKEHTRKIPAYPIVADYELPCGDESIQVCEHLGSELGDTRCIVMLIPGVFGGVGPCRAPGVNYDDEALYPSVARGRLSKGDTDCYRVSWQHRSPDMKYAVSAVCGVVNHAVCKANKRYKLHGLKVPKVRVVFVGHSLGAPIALHAAEVMARHCRTARSQEISVAGVCTLNGSKTAPLQLTSKSLSGMHALMICGTSDEVVSPIMTEHLYEIFPSKSKHFIRLPYGTHDLFVYKEVLQEVLEHFIISAAFQSESRQRSPESRASRRKAKGEEP